MTFTRIKAEDLTTQERLHYHQVDVHSLTKVLNSILKDVYDLQKIQMDRDKREYGNVKVN